MNSINLVGRIGHDLELKQTPNGVPVCSFTIAVKRPKVKDVVDWIPCTVWRQGAEYICKYGRKGNMVAVTGILTTRSYEDKNRNKRIAYEVSVDGIMPVSDNTSSAPKQGQGVDANNAPTPYSAESVDFTEMTDDDSLPF